jgi:predicted CXXCH cytochrome family protein
MMHALRKYYLVVLALTATAALAPGIASAGISGTSHDLSGSAPGAQLCVACHTPHVANSSLLLWNHVYSASSFSWSDATQTTGGTTLPINIKTWSGSSKNCLSCHDGTVEVGKTYNPASTWDPSKIVGSAKIGPDLKGSHPIALPYPNNGVVNTYNGTTTGLGVTLATYKNAPTKVKLFRDPSAGANNYGIECASCHDPHSSTYSDFLRDSTAGSAICLNCHSM